MQSSKTLTPALSLFERAGVNLNPAIGQVTGLVTGQPTCELFSLAASHGGRDFPKNFAH